MPQTKKARSVFSVTQLNRQIKQLIESHFFSIWVEGEISNFTRASSGHWYLSLKDQRAQVRCAMFKGSNSRLAFNPKEGDKVVVRGKSSLYEARGDYQLIIDHMEPAGIGDLAKAFEMLKQKLKEEGLFDPQFKQELPAFPKHIAIISSAKGAAIHDMVSILRQRCPTITVTILPATVQGETAAKEIAQQIAFANHLVNTKQRDFDVLIVGRGGGSIEDLWAFNEEVLARAIFNSELPIVSAVGHETDITIADFVADRRAATPSAAAEILSPDSRTLLQQLNKVKAQLLQTIKHRLQQEQSQLSLLEKHIIHPGSRIKEQQQRLDELEMRLIKAWEKNKNHHAYRLSLTSQTLKSFSPQNLISEKQLILNNSHQQLVSAFQQIMLEKDFAFKSISQRLNTISPLATLERGYSITRQGKKVITDSNSVKIGQEVTVSLFSGELNCSVISKSQIKINS